MLPEAPPTGLTLGRYTLEHLIGQGGFAWVYAARRDDGNSFAVKILKPRYANDPAFESRFRQESRFAAELEFPNIVRIEEVGNASGLIFFTMALYPESLASRISDDRALPDADLLPIALGVTRALAFAHARNVVHRDIKPDNILIAADGTPVLTDFGIARAVSGYVAATGFMMTIGTPHYISPEQAQGRGVDGRSDLYSLGITLYRAVAGELPFRSRDWFELARMHVETTPEPPRAKHPEISKRFERIILKLLAKHPNDRYATAEALLADLEDFGPRTRPTSAITLPEGYLRESKAVDAKLEEKKRWWKPWEKP